MPAALEPTWVLLGEKRIARLAAARVAAVQGDQRDLLAGAYVVLAAGWGVLGGALMLAFIVSGMAGDSVWLLFALGVLCLAVSAVRQVQSRRSRDGRAK